MLMCWTALGYRKTYHGNLGNLAIAPQRSEKVKKLKYCAYGILVNSSESFRRRMGDGI